MPCTLGNLCNCKTYEQARSCSHWEEPDISTKPEARDPLLVEREKTHGDYRSTAEVAQKLKKIIKENREHPNLRKLHSVHQESLDMICTKIARIVCGNEAEKDHWLDIAGYAKLGAEACEEPHVNHKPGGVTYVK